MLQYDVHTSAPFAVFGAMALLASVALALTVPETKDLQMPDKMPHRARGLRSCCCMKTSHDARGDAAEEIELRKNVEI